jgi:guanylate kinase
MRPLLLILSAPSGTGKTTLARRLVAAHPGAVFSVSYTTRPPRPHEQQGVDYHFVSEKQFQRMIKDGAFVEWAEVHGNHYGTPRSVIEQAKGLVVFDIDVQGGQNIKRRHPAAVRVLILPPSLEELERRLRARSTDDEATVRRRLDAAQREIARAADYEHRVVNDDLERAYADLEAIVRSSGA